mmetsp:Transcript_45962/g.114282  ORF Transcript_45962/g.114282 Transcript_45962/m.114282 type:complete len:243 (+) Transcript_45962:97-825(+)
MAAADVSLIAEELRGVRLSKGGDEGHDDEIDHEAEELIKEAQSPMGGKRSSEARQSVTLARRFQMKLMQEITKEKPDFEKIRALQAFDVDFSVKDPESEMTLLHHGAWQGEVDIIQLALSAGVDVNAETKLGRTALHFACVGNHPRAIKWLVDHGADINKPTIALLTPLHLAARSGAEDAVKCLLSDFPDKQVFADMEDNERLTPLDVAKTNAIKTHIHKYLDRNKKKAKKTTDANKPVWEI